MSDVLIVILACVLGGFAGYALVWDTMSQHRHRLRIMTKCAQQLFGGDK